MTDPAAFGAEKRPGTVNFRVLGPFQVCVGGAPIGLPGGKPKAVLAALVVSRNSIVPGPELMAAAWNDDPPASAGTALQVAISTVRKALRESGIDAIRTDPPGYRVVIAPGALDLDVFLRSRQRGRLAAAVGDHQSAAHEYAAALAEFTGEPLADLRGLRFADEFAVAWQEERLGTVHDRIDSDLRCGRHDHVIAELGALLAHHPLRETLWARLITALHLAGRQAEALDAGRRVRAVLAEELGVDPGPAVRDAEQRVLRQERALPPVPPMPVALQTMTDAPGAVRGWLVDPEGVEHPIAGAAIRVGRLPTNDIVLDDVKVSRQHAVVVDTGTGCLVTDLGSTNGTRVAGRRVVGNQLLADGDIIEIGSSTLRYRAAGQGARGDGDPSAGV